MKFHMREKSIYTGESEREPQISSLLDFIVSRFFSKYVKMFEDVQHLVDPSRNMSKYRQHLALVSQEPPVVPIYPVLKKDLTFAHEGNPTYCEKLINFEKLRMIAKAVHAVTKLCSAPYEIGVMAEQVCLCGIYLQVLKPL